MIWGLLVILAVVILVLPGMGLMLYHFYKGERAIGKGVQNIKPSKTYSPGVNRYGCVGDRYAKF
jgi:flagellar basal body-associated protein FliL